MRKFLVPALGLLLLVSFVPVASAGIAQDEISVSLELGESATRTLTFLNPENEDVDVELEIWGEIKQFVSVDESVKMVGALGEVSFTLTFEGSEAGAFEGIATVAGEWTPIVLTVYDSASPELGKMNVTLISLGDEFDIIPILPDLPFAPTTIASGFNLIYVTDSETGGPVDASVALNFFTPALWGGMELDPMLMFMMLQGGALSDQLFGMGLEVPIVDGVGVLFVPEGVGLARATVRAEGYGDFGFFLRIGEATEAVELSVSVPGDPAAGLVGISVNIDGEPAEGAGVYVDGEHQGKTDAEGNFAVTLDKGSHTIRVEYQSLERSADITAWEARSTRIELQKARVNIGDTAEGKLVDEYGNPVPIASVTLGGQSGLTGADGGFELSTEGLETGMHSVISGHKYDPATYLSYASSLASIEITSTGTPWWQYVVAVLILLIFLRVAMVARRRIKKLPVRPGPPGATET